jgi:hypothetical protein
MPQVARKAQLQQEGELMAGFALDIESHRQPWRQHPYSTPWVKSDMNSGVMDGSSAGASELGFAVGEVLWNSA